MRPTIRLLTLVAAAAISLGVGAATAAARRPQLPKIAFYKVVYEGSGSYSVKQSDGPSFANIASSFRWSLNYQLAIFQRSGQPVTGLARTGSGSGDWSIQSDNGGGDTCSRHGGLKMQVGGGVVGRVQSSGKAIMHLIPGMGEDFTTTDGSSGSQACDTTDFWHDWVTSFSHVGTDENVDPLEAFVTLSKADQRAGKVVFNVSNHTLAAPSLTVDSNCGSGNGASCTQSYDWTGHVTFTKTKRPNF